MGWHSTRLGPPIRNSRGYLTGRLRVSLGKVSIGSAANPGDSPDAVAVVAAGLSRSIHPSNPRRLSGMGERPPDIGCFQGQIRDHRLSDGERHSRCRRLSPPLTDHHLFPPGWKTTVCISECPAMWRFELCHACVGEWIPCTYHKWLKESAKPRGMCVLRLGRGVDGMAIIRATS